MADMPPMFEAAALAARGISLAQASRTALSGEISY